MKNSDREKKDVFHAKGFTAPNAHDSGVRGRGQGSYPVVKGQTEWPGLKEATPKSIPKGIEHVEDLSPEDFIAFIEKLKDLPIKGGLEISEKVDGSARISFGIEAGNIWTQSKNGPKRLRASDYPDIPMFTAIKAAASALESDKLIAKNWPKNVSFFVAEVLYTNIPNAIEYGPNVIMIHGVHSETDKKFSDEQSKKAALKIIAPTNGKLQDSNGSDWKFDYKPNVPHKNIKIDVKKEFASASELSKELEKLRPDKLKKSGKEAYKKALSTFKEVQLQVKKKLLKVLAKQRSVYGPKDGDVEGLVFRDLDSGKLVKLVDKDYFTKLNKYFWKFRELLNKGTKVTTELGEEWQHGVFQEFKNIIADEILGAGIAKTPGFVKHLSAFGSKVKIPAGVEGEAKVDVILLKYIQSLELMDGNFFTRFDSMVERLHNRVEELYSEWKDEQSKDSGVELTKGDGSAKTVKMPDIIKKRTEDAFSETKKFVEDLSVLKKSLQSMKNDNERRVALLKIMLGKDRLDKVIHGLEDVETSESRNVNEGPPPIPQAALAKKAQAAAQVVPPPEDKSKENKLDKPDVTNSVSALKLLNKFKDKLLKKHINISGAKMLGEGSRGTAFDVGGGKVLKITDDKAEAVAALKVKSQPLKRVVEIYDVFRLPELEIFCIFQEKLEKLSSSEEQELNNALVRTELPICIAYSDYDWEKAKEMSKEKVMKKIVVKFPDFKTDDTQRKGAEEFANGVNKDWKLLINKYGMSEIVKELKQAGILFHDYHAGNMMKRSDGSIVMIDLGYSKVKGGKEPDVLERIVREITESLIEANVESVGLTIGRFQPFHRGHAAIVRQLASKYTKVVLIIAGNKQEVKNPFSFELREKIIKDSLADIISKIEIYKAEAGGKPTGFIPALLGDISLNQNSSINADTAVNVLVGPDRVEDFKRQIKSAIARKEKGEDKDITYDPYLVNVQGLPGLSGDDDTAGRISGTQVRQAIADNNKKLVASLMDPLLVSNPDKFNSIYEQLRKELSKFVQIKELKETITQAGGEDAIFAALKKKDIADLLKSKKNIDTSTMTRLGRGQMGIAYRLAGDKVLKVTTDELEASASNLIKKKPLNHIVRVDDAFRIPKEKTGLKQDVFGILQEHLEPLSKQEKDEFDSVADYLRDNSIISTTAQGNWNQIEWAVKKVIRKDVRSDLQLSPEAPVEGSPQFNSSRETKYRNIVKQKTDAFLNTTKKIKLEEIIKELRANQIKFADFHSGNLMKRGSAFVLIDLGFAKSPGTIPPTLENIVGKVVESFISEFGVNGANAMGNSVGFSQTGTKAGSSGFSSSRNELPSNYKGQSTGSATWMDRMSRLQILSPDAGKLPEKRTVHNDSSNFERLVTKALVDKGLDAKSTGDTTSLPDIKLTIDGKTSYVEVKMLGAQLASPRFKFDGEKWLPAGEKSSPLTEAVLQELNSSQETKKFVSDLRDFVSKKRGKSTNIKIVSTEKPSGDIVTRDEMAEFVSNRDQYVFKKDNIDVTNIVKGHYSEGKAKAAPYLQFGNDFYLFGDEDPFDVEREVPKFKANGRLAIRVSIRSKKYEIQPDIKAKKYEGSDYSIIDSDKKFPFKIPKK